MQKNGRFAQSMEMSKSDKLWKDAMETAADSKDPTVVETLLRFFVANDNPGIVAITVNNLGCSFI